MNAVLLGGASMLLAAACVRIVDADDGEAEEEILLEDDKQIPVGEA